MASRRVKRIVEKDGRVNIDCKSVLAGPYSTIAEWSFLKHLMVVFLLCLVPWLVFACIWHFTFWLHGDLEPDHLPNKQKDSDWTPCVFAIHNFTSSFLFSLETQRSIGYGLRGTSDKCPDSVILEMIQSIFGILIECLIAIIIYIKMTRGICRYKSILFSHNAVVSLVNGKPRLMFRVMNMHTKIETRYHGYIVHKVTTKEGMVMNHHFTRIQLSSQVEEDIEDITHPCNLTTPVLPNIVSHTLDSTSPLYNLSPDNIMDMELVITMEVVEPNGSKFMVMTSYLQEEIVWSNHFAECVTYNEEVGMFVVEVEKINFMVPNNTPRMSAKNMDEAKSTSNSVAKYFQKKEKGFSFLDLSFNYG